MGLSVCENVGLQASRIYVCSDLPVIMIGESNISKIMVISQVSETLMDIGGACIMGWLQCQDCTSTKMRDILSPYLVNPYNI